MSRIRSLGDAGGQGGVHRFAHLTLACLLAALGAALLAGPAQAALSAAGPVNPQTRFPDWYQDGSGLKLQLCVDGPPLCLAARNDLTAPEGEAFWWQAEATVNVDGGTALLVLAQEAAFAGDAPISFGRIRITVRGARPNTTYTFDHPYGSANVTTDGLGNGRSDANDVGCGAGPCDWNAALATDIGPQFLRWDPSVAPAAPAGFAGDAATPHRVTGGRLRNTFGVSGGAVTDLFTVQGKLAGDPFPVFEGPTELGFGSTAPGVPVIKDVIVKSFGVPDAAGRSNLNIGAVGVSGPNPAAFTIVGDTCSNRGLPSGASCAVNVRFVPGAPGATSATLDVPHNGANLGSKVVLSGEGTAPAVAPVAGTVAGAGAGTRSALAIAKLRTTHRLSRARVLRRGLRLSLRVPQGTEILKIAVHRVRRGRAEARNVWLGFRVVSRAGLIRVRLDSRALRRRLRAGLYQVNVTPGASRRQLGRTTTTRIRITRR